MKYIDYISKYLDISSSIEVGTATKRRKIINISIKKITVIKVLVYLIFCAANIFFLLAFFGQESNLSIEINGKTLSQQSLNSNELLIASAIVFAVCTIYAFVKRHIILTTKEAKPYNVNLYNRDLPVRLTPAHVRLLVEDGLMDSESLASTILDLIDRGYLMLEAENRCDLFTKNLFISVTNKSQEDLFDYEKYLIWWLFSNGRVSSSELKKKLNNVSEEPCEKFETWEGLVLASFPLNKYYKKCNPKKRVLYIIMFLSFFASLMFLSHIKSLYVYTICLFLPLYGLANLFFACPSYLLNEEGAELRDRFLDLKRFLVEFSLIKERTSEMIVIWNYYLSYSVALGIKGVAGSEIKSFFGKNIYNQYDDTSSSGNRNREPDANTMQFIDATPEIIKRAEILYKNRNI